MRDFIRIKLDAEGNEVPTAVVFVHSSREAKVPATEVLSHEALEMLVDPYVMDEADIRKYAVG